MTQSSYPKTKEETGKLRCLFEKLLNRIESQGLVTNWEDSYLGIYESAKNEFPFTDGIENGQNIMKIKGYYSAAIEPYFAQAIRDWFVKWIGELEIRPSPTTARKEE